jgi:hypothetical protein
MQDFNKLNHVAQRHYGERRMCGVIAVASITGMSFGRARVKMAKQGRKHAGSSNIYQIIGALEQRGFTVATGMAPDEPLTVVDLAAELEAECGGSYLILSARHITASVDGLVNDWAAEANRPKGKRRPRAIMYWHVTKNETV